MARRSPPLVNQKCETGCTTWRMFGIFNFREGHSDRTLVSNSKRLNKHATGIGNSRSSSDVLSTVDVSSRRIRDYSCKSISVEIDHVADWENEVAKMIVNQRFFNKKYQGKKDGAGCEPSQFLDAVQILYSNKELFIKLLQDPNSLLVKQIHDLQSSQVKETHQARQKNITRLNKSQNNNARQHVKHFKTFDRHNSSSNCEPHSSKRIVVLKPSHFPFGRIKRKLRHVMRVRRKEQQWRTTDAVPLPSKFPCSSRGLEDGKNVKEFEIGERNSPINAHASTGRSSNSYIDLKKRDMVIKVKDSELCVGKEAVSFGENCDSLVSTSEQNTLNEHVEGSKGPSHVLNYGIEKCKKCTNSLEDSPTQNFNTTNTSEGLGSLQDSDSEIQILSFSPDIASSSPLMDLSTFDELKGLTGKFSCSPVMHECVIETFMELYKNCGFPNHFSSRNPNFQACDARKVLVKEITELVDLHFFPRSSIVTLQQLVERDFARSGTWLNVQADTEDIAVEVEKDVLEKLVLEIASEMENSDLMHCDEPMSMS